MEQSGQGAETGAERLRAYLPRLALEWAATEPASRSLTRDGTLCFVDISGFTNLSERLARRGRIGAEELTAILSDRFGRLLDLAHARGGGLLKFGGDALLLWFDGDEHVRRGVAAALEMRAALRATSVVSTSSGAVRLKMSVGLHTGLFDFFHVGATHREFLVCGPAASQTVAMEQAASAGEIVVSAAIVAAIGERFVGEPRGDGRLLRGMRFDAPTLDVAPLIDVPESTIITGVPRLLRDELLAGLTEAEHRSVTVGFIRFDGSDTLLARQGTDGLLSALDELVFAVQEATALEEVTFLATDVDSNGGKVIVVGGAPCARDDDAGRVLRAVTAALRRSGPLRARAGVHRGHVFAGEIGTEWRRTYTVMGDTVNLAARLMAQAKPGQAIATAAALDRAASRFAVRALAPFKVKGKRDEIHAFTVGEVLEARRREPGTMPFTGRADELADVRARLVAAREGHGGAVRIAGAPGIGKSRLVDEVVRSVPGARVVMARGEPYALSTPYLPFRLLLRSLLGLRTHVSASELVEAVVGLAPETRPWLPLLGVVFAIDLPATPEADALDPAFRRSRLERTVVTLLARLLEPGTLVWFDDLHWFDDASRELAQRIVATAAERAWLVIATERLTAQPLAGADLVELGPLPDAVVRRLVEAATDAAPLLPHDVEALVERSAGSPLSCEELVRAVRQAGIDDLPDSLEGAITAEIDRLPPPARRMLRYASVLGRTSRLELLFDLLGSDADAVDAGSLEALRDFLVLEDDERVTFRHALTRDVAYETLSFGRRRELHERAGVHLERHAAGDPERYAELCSLHFSAAHMWHPAWGYATLAGDRATRAFASLDAASHYERALTAARYITELSPAQIADVWARLGDAREIVGMFDEAADAYRRAERLLSDAVARADVVLRRSRAYERKGAYRAAVREVRRCLRVLENLDGTSAGALRARATAWEASLRQAQGRSREAVRLALRAVDDAKQYDALDAIARAYMTLDAAHIDLGEVERAVHTVEALEILERLGDLPGQARALSNLGVEAYYEGRWIEAASFYERAAQASRRTGDVVQAALSTSNLAEIFVNQGRLDEATQAVAAASRVFRAAKFVDGLAFASILDGRIAVARGDFDRASELFSAAKQEYVASDAKGAVLECEMHEAACALAAGRADEALERADAALAFEASHAGAAAFTPELLRVRGGALARLGRIDDAREALEAGYKVARERGLVYDEVLVLATWEALLPDDGRAPSDADLASLGIERVPVLLTPAG